MVIIKLQDKYTKQLSEGITKGKVLPKYIEEKVYMLLAFLHKAKTLDEFQQLSGIKLEKLHGDLNGFHSMRVNIQYRIIFIWKNGDADEVKLTNHYK